MPVRSHEDGYAHLEGRLHLANRYGEENLRGRDLLAPKDSKMTMRRGTRCGPLCDCSGACVEKTG